MNQSAQSSSYIPGPRALKRTGLGTRLSGGLLFLFGIATASPLCAANDDQSNEYRFTLSPYNPIRGNLSGFGELGYYWNPEQDYQTYTILWPGLTYQAAPWAQLSAGLRSLYTDHEDTADKLELRPFAGVKLILPNELKWQFYNHTRYEFRSTQDRSTDDWTDYHRVRSRFGVEFPLTSRGNAWQPKSWYGLADVEPIYRFDTDRIDPLVARGGIGYILNDRIRMELIYHAVFTRPARSRPLEFTENMIRVNLKIGLRRGLLRQLQSPNQDD
jgi:hypothetical protein